MKRLVLLAAVCLAGCQPPAEPPLRPEAAEILGAIKAPSTRVVRRCADGKTAVLRTEGGRFLWFSETWASTQGDWLPEGVTPEGFCS